MPYTITDAMQDEVAFLRELAKVEEKAGKHIVAAKYADTLVEAEVKTRLPIDNVFIKLVKYWIIGGVLSLSVAQLLKFFG